MRTTILLCLALFMVGSIYAQTEERLSDKSHFFVKGGLNYSFDKHHYQNSAYNLSHLNFQKFGFGFLRFKKDIITHFLLDLSYFNRDFGVTYYETSLGTPEVKGGVNFSNLLVELEYYRSFSKLNFLNNKIYLGYLVNLNYTTKKVSPFVSYEFPATASCFCLGTGLKGIFVLKRFQNSMLLLSSKVNLIDFGLGVDRTYNPILPIKSQKSYGFDLSFLRTRMGLDLSYVF